MKKMIFAATLTAGLMLGLAAQSQAQWSEYSRGSSEWHRMNRESMTRPWKRDPISGRVRGGRRAKGKKAAAKHVVRRNARQR